MFKIQPIQNKTEQENAAVRCGVPYLPDAMAYAAEIDGAFSGICQFSIRGEHGMIHHLVPLPGVVVPDEVPASNTSAYAENLSVAKVMVPLAASYVAGSFS